MHTIVYIVIIMTSEEKVGGFAGLTEDVMYPDNLNSSPEETTLQETSTTSSSSAADDEQQRYPNENTFSENRSNKNTLLRRDNSQKDTTENTANMTMSSVASSNLCVNANIASSDNSTNNGNHRKIFEVLYLGSTDIDKRYSSPHFVMPWVMAEVKRKKTEGFREIKLEVRDVSLRGTIISNDEGEFYPDHIAPGHNVCLSGGTGHGDSTAPLQGRQVILFEHKLHGVSRFAKLHQEPRCFAYLTRPQLNSDYHCHVFMAPEEHQIPELFASIRKATKEHRDDASDGSLFFHDVGDSAEPAKAFCEVMYLGKAQVDNRKLTSTDIDRLAERICSQDDDGYLGVDKIDSRQRHASDASVRSLPASLDSTVVVTENDLEQQHKQLHGVKLNGVYESVEEFHGVESPGSSFENIEESSDMKIDMSKDFTDGDKEVNLEEKGIGSSTVDSVNQTMLFRLGKDEISLIHLDQKKVILERKFSDISFVSQGHKNQEIFGFTARDPGNVLICHLLKCHSDSVVDEIMMSVKSAFKSAFEQNKLHMNQICTMCPLHQLQKLCQEINDLSASSAVDLLKQRIHQLPEKDAAEMHNRWKQENPQSNEELLEVMMVSLRKLCEQKQREHHHISTGKCMGKLEFNIMNRRSKISKLDNLKNKAKKSLTNSFESLIRGRKKEEARDAFRQRSGTTDSESSWTAQSFDSSAPTTPELSPSASPMSKERRFYLPTPPDSPTSGIRPRSSTVGAIPMSTARVTKQRPTPPSNVGDNYGQYQAENSRTHSVTATSPMKHMFLISGSSMAQLSPESASSSVCSSYEEHGSMMATPTRRGSWRQAIFNRVVTPADNSQTYSLDESPSQEMICKRSTLDARARWRKAIQETLLLIRMNKENQNLRARQDEIQQKRQNLDYEEITPCLKEVTKVWDTMLNNPDRKNTQFDPKILEDCIKQGVPKSRRGAIWQLLVEQNQLKSPMMSTGSGLDDVAYDDLMRRLTTHQHAILIDLGRTFPKHPYFRTQLGPGQLALFNLLKAYSLLDTEVGYCQGLSFIAGMLLIHMDEESAFNILKYLMFNMGLRNQYRPSMTALQIKLYQLTRLIHDNHRDLYEHFEEHEIVPTLYAAPWFLTIFASQFPLGFVSRVFDLIFYQGIDAIFKVCLILLGDHKELIMHCESFENIVEFLKTTLPGMGLVQMERIINQAFQVDYTKQLHAYEVEYQVLQEEMVYMSPKERCSGNSIIHRLEGANRNLKEQNHELMDKLQNAHSHHRSLESAINTYQTNETCLRSKIQALELERSALLDRVSILEKERNEMMNLGHLGATGGAYASHTDQTAVSDSYQDQDREHSSLLHLTKESISETEKT